jgi:hypothetical protein
MFTDCDTYVDKQLLLDEFENKSQPSIYFISIKTCHKHNTQQPLDQYKIECEPSIFDLVPSKILIRPSVNHPTQSLRLQTYTFNLLDCLIRFMIKPQSLIYSSPTEICNITFKLINNLMMQRSNLDNFSSFPYIGTIETIDSLSI